MPRAGSSHLPVRRIRVAALSAALMFTASTLAHAQNDYRSKPGEAFAVVRSAPDAVIQFHGLHLKSARTDEARNEIVLTFDGQADRYVFDRLQTALPGLGGERLFRI